jgi:hypothetical protein
MPIESLSLDPLDECKRVRIFRVSHELLAEVLMLPAGTKIVGVSEQPFFFSGELAIKVEHPAFDPVPPVKAIPEYAPMYSQVTTPKFDGWQPR